MQTLVSSSTLKTPKAFSQPPSPLEKATVRQTFARSRGVAFIGYLLGASFAEYINVISSWIAFALLCLIGGNMIREALSKDEETASADLDIKTMLVMAIATSIDALAVGIAIACEKINILAVSDIVNTLIGVGIIGIITCIISCFGVKIGNVFGSKFKSKAEFCGGLILIFIGVKILLEYFGIL